jgi:transaldolase
MDENPLLKLQALGQSVWLDQLSRGLLNSGRLQRLIEEDGLRGVTSNPAIFEQAVSGSTEYDEDIGELFRQGKTPEEVYEALLAEDARRAADLLRPVYDATGAQDGFVSVAVSPHSAYDTERTLVEARRLWEAVNRPNVMIKAPATRQGLTAIRLLTAEGVNVNATLLFGPRRYREAAGSYVAGLETRAGAGAALAGVASAASFFISPIDALADSLLEKVTEAAGPQSHLAKAIVGEVAIACAKIAYQKYNEIFAAPRFVSLIGLGARRQRLVWASTSTKDPSFGDIRYIEALIGPGTVNTMPLETLEAYRDHGHPERRLDEGIEAAHQILQALSGAGIDFGQAAEQLEHESVRKFVARYDQTLERLKEKRQSLFRPAA